MDNKEKSGILIIGFIVLLIIQFSIIGSLFIKTNRLENLIATFNDQLTQQSSVLTNNMQKQDNGDLYTKIDFMNLCNRLSNNTIATDKFYIHRFILINENTIEIGFLPQPNQEDILIEKGKFKLTDRELKVALIDLISKVNVKYEEWSGVNKSLPRLSDYEIKLTNYNYSIGIFDNGKITLVGE
jgi:hypothetical protein